jgi:hypothetical protein
MVLSRCSARKTTAAALVGVVIGLSFIHNPETSEIYISGGGRLKPVPGGEGFRGPTGGGVSVCVRARECVCVCACLYPRGRREVRVTREVYTTGRLRRRRWWLTPPVER